MAEKRNNMEKLKVAAVLVALVAVSIIVIVVEHDCHSEKLLKRFSSYDELAAYIKKPPSGYYGDFYQNGGLQTAGFASSSSKSSSDGGTGSGSSPTEYSSTNIQVEGVDEPDIVKTDGKFIYTVSQNDVVIAKAYPAPDAKVISRLKFDGVVEGLFINGDRLVVFETNRSYYSYYEEYRGHGYSGCRPPETFIKVYRISDCADPLLEKNISAGGTYMDSRMIGDRAYVIVMASTTNESGSIALPVISDCGIDKKVDATEIGYFDITAASYYYYTIILSVDVRTEGKEPTYDVYLTDYSQNVYVSCENIYLTQGGCSGWYYSRSDTEKTYVHKISIDDGKIRYICSANVPGHVLNQFSMDEFGGYFRIATTVGEPWNGDSTNNVYILDGDLNRTGGLEGLAHGEKIYSVRFMGDKCFIVTFKKVDPFFVIDLGNPHNPRVLGELKIPGYSEYLHPYDPTHIIGIGKDAVDEGKFAWYQGLKLSLFDVTDFYNPKEISRYNIGDRGTGSFALYDHKAFLFNLSRHLLVIPVSLAEINESMYPNGSEPFTYGEHVWDGAYIFSVTLERGFELKGRITHSDNASSGDGYYYSTPYSVKRTLYIDDTLYTVSEKSIRMNLITDLHEVNQIKL